MTLPFFLASSVVVILYTLNVVGKRFGMRVFFVTLVSVIVTLLVGVLNYAAGPLPGADVDAIAFERIARDLAATWNLTGIYFLSFFHRYAYSNVLAVLFYVDGFNYFLIPLFNAALTTFAAYNVYLSARILNVREKYIFVISLLLAFNPIVILYSAVSMREAPIYALIALFFRVLISEPKRPAVLLNPMLLTIVALLVFLHIGLAVLVLVLVAYAFDFSISLKSIARPKNLLTVLVLFVVVDFAMSTQAIQSIPRMAKLLDPESSSMSYESLQSAQQAKSRGEGAYTYPERIIGIPIVDSIITAAYMTIRLILSPFPWEIRSAGVTTLIKIIDISLQLSLHVLAISNLRRRNGRDKTVFLYTSYLLLSLVFGLNTVNDGVALRHRTKFFWLLVLAAFSARAGTARSLSTDKSRI